MWVRLSAFLVWALVAAALTYWALRLLASAPAAPAHTVTVAGSVGGRTDLTRLFGAPPVAAAAAVADPEVSSRFRLVGVMAPRAEARGDAAAQGVALIAVDDKPPKAFAVGAVLDGELVLQSVSLRTASIGPAQGEAAVKLEIPPLPPPATGTLPAPDGVTAPPPVNRPAPVLPRPLPPPVQPAPPPVPQLVPQMLPQAQPPAATQVIPQGAPPVLQQLPPGVSGGASPGLVPEPPSGMQPRDSGRLRQ